jgi:glycosyltransferase involved in cell wall biosynthesis
MKNAVFSFFPYQTSGNTFAWWDEFPKRISDALKQRGIAHLTFYRDYADASTHPPQERYTATKQQLKSSVWTWRNLRKYARKFDKVIFHTHKCSFHNGLWVFNSVFNKSYHCVATDHNLWAPVKTASLKMHIRKLVRNLGFLPEVIIGCSNASKNRLNRIYGSKNIGFIYNGIDTPDISAPKPLKEVPKKALFVGRLEEYKGLWPLLKAFAVTKDKMDVRLAIAGNGKLYNALQQYIEKHGLNSIVTLLGYVSNIPSLMQQHDFIIIPSTHEENCPITSLEAQVNFLPCIYADSGGLPETQIEGKTGIMVRKNSSEDIIKAIKFFQEDIERFNQMRMNARQNAFNFSMDKMAESYCDLYSELFAK